MPTLLEDLVKESSASNRRFADRVAEEAAQGNRGEVIQSARQAADRAISRVPEAEDFWNEALAAFREEPTGAHVESLLRLLLNSFESSRQLVQSARALWEVAIDVGASPERLQQLEQAERRFEELASEAKRALEHRAAKWQPADPTRLAQGLQTAREGKTIKADEARSRFRQTKS
jgi:hypothetical protein